MTMATRFKSPLQFAGSIVPELAGHKQGVLDPSIPGDATNYGWKRSFKNPKDLAEQVRKENELHANRRKTISPLDEFKLYESTIYSGPDFEDNHDYFGIPLTGEGSSFGVAYPKLLEQYGKSKGQHAKTINPEVQKYFNDRLAYRQGLYDRVNKVPEEKWENFIDEYGPYADPFDYEGGDAPISKKDFLESFDYAPDWDILESYLKEKGY